jgi:multiple sugar transport system substrate-binding protein
VSAARRLAGAVVALTLAASVVGCTSDDDPGADPTPSPESTTPTPTGPVEIEVAVYGDAARLRTYRQIADAFTEANPDVVVTVVEHADAAEAAALARNALVLGAGPDVFLTDHQYLPELVETNGLAPVDALLEARGLQFGDDHQRVALTSMSANNRLQCMPAEMSPKVVYYNKRLVPRRQLKAVEVIVPNAVVNSWSWSDFATTARTVAGLDRLGTIKGVYLPPDIDTLTALVRSADGEVVDDVFEPTSLTLASDSALEAIGELVTLARDPAVSLTREDLKARDPIVRFTEGQLGMYVGTRDDLPVLREADGLSFDVAPLPAFDRSQSVSEVNGYCLNAGTEHLDAAADFVAFAVGEEAAEIAARSDVIVPARLDTLAEDVFRQPGEQPRNSQVFATSLRRSVVMPYDTAWPRVAELAEGVVARLFYGFEVDVDAVLEDRMVRLDEQSELLFSDGENDTDTD